MTIAPTRKAFAVWFKDLDLWSVNSFFRPHWRWPLKYIEPLGEALERRFETVDLAAKAAGLTPLITLRFDGSMELRNARTEDIKGGLFSAYAGDLVFSRIDVRNGAIGIVPEQLPHVAVSNEFPVYHVRPEKALTEYVHLLVRSTLFRGVLNSLISGASGRKRVQATQFESIQVPLPPLETQRAIVDYWHCAQHAQQEAEARIAAHEAAIDTQFLADLGIERRAKIQRPKFFAAYWKGLERWSFDSALDKVLGLHDSASASYPHVNLGSVATVSYGIQKSPANRPGQHPRPYLRVANVRRGYLDLSEIKYINVPDSEMETYRLKPGDILFVEGNGSRAELGRVAKWNGEIEDCVHQNHLIKVRVDQQQLSPEY
ncbi:MAG: restriction endonuclease subunit S, partial [Abitibacteriaceae bacterium]|nr:restriction endonuclease subunit S [Abditibacteriaceae bacterium]